MTSAVVTINVNGYFTPQIKSVVSPMLEMNLWWGSMDTSMYSLRDTLLTHLNAWEVLSLVTRIQKYLLFLHLTQSSSRRKFTKLKKPTGFKGGGG